MRAGRWFSRRGRGASGRRVRAALGRKEWARAMVRLIHLWDGGRDGRRPFRRGGATRGAAGSDARVEDHARAIGDARAGRDARARGCPSRDARRHRHRRRRRSMAVAVRVKLPKQVAQSTRVNNAALLCLFTPTRPAPRIFSQTEGVDWETEVFFARSPFRIE